MNLSFRMSVRVNRPIDDVFQAVVDPIKLAQYFVATSTGPLREGAHVDWQWPDGEKETVEVVALDHNHQIKLRWKAYRVETKTDVTFTFEPHPLGGTRVLVGETGFQETQADLDASYEQCAGWMHMLMCLKAHVERDIDLRG